MLSRPRVVVPAGALLFLLGAGLPWFRTPTGGAGDRAATTVNGFDAGMLVVAAGALVLAAVWALLPDRAVPRLPFPAALVTAGLTVLSLLFTVPEWLTTFDRGVSAAGLLAVLGAAVATVSALTAAVVAVRAWPLAPPRSAAATAPDGDPDEAATPDEGAGQGGPGAATRPGAGAEGPAAAGVRDGADVDGVAPPGQRDGVPGLGRPWAVEARE
ncbi:hypothetical protein [Modestobacter lacusdianchii]